MHRGLLRIGLVADRVGMRVQHPLHVEWDGAVGQSELLGDRVGDPVSLDRSECGVDELSSAGMEVPSPGSA